MAATTQSVSERGFRTFWKRGGKNEQDQDLRSVGQDALPKQKPGRLSNLFARSPSPESKDRGNAQSEAQKRRSQVYQAQKRHRNRKAEYTASLEAEVARLRHVDAEVNDEKNTLAHQNRAMKELLTAQSVDAQLEAMELSSKASSVSNLNASLNMCYDEQIEQDRWFADLIESTNMQWTSSEASGLESEEAQPTTTSIPGDSWAALDFILALEHPCRDHVHHAVICPNGYVPDAGEMHGHAMTATAAVFAGAQPPPSSNESGPGAAEKWHLPHAEIERLIELSQGLATDDSEITPAQAYSAILETVPNSAYLRPTLRMLKQPLAKLVHCAHFGSTLDTAAFWQHFSATIQSLRFTRPELET